MSLPHKERSFFATTVKILLVPPLVAGLVAGLLPIRNASAEVPYQPVPQETEPPIDPSAESDQATVTEMRSSDLTPEQRQLLDQMLGDDAIGIAGGSILVVDAIKEHVIERNVRDGCKAHGENAQKVVDASRDIETFRKSVKRLAIGLLEDGVVSMIVMVVEIVQGKPVVMVVQNPDLTRLNANPGTALRVDNIKAWSRWIPETNQMEIVEYSNVSNADDVFSTLERFLAASWPGCKAEPNGNGNPELVTIPDALPSDPDFTKDGVNLGSIPGFDEEDFATAMSPAALPAAVVVAMLGGTALLFSTRRRQEDAE